MKQSNTECRLDGKIPARIKYTFAFGALGKDMIYGMIATFSMIYFTDILKVNPAFIGIMFFVAKIWDAFNDLFMGMVVDNTRTRWGKFIPWLVIATLVNSVNFIILFTDFHLSGVGLCVDYGEYKIGVRNEGVVFSLQTLIVKVTAALTALGIGVVLNGTQYVPGQKQSFTTVAFISSLMCIVPAICMIIAYIVYRMKYKLNDSMMKRIVNTITARREGKITIKQEINENGDIEPSKFMNN